MEEKNKYINNRLSEQLPSHSPDPESWQRLSAKLDAMDAEAAYQEKLQQLPLHSPDQGTWNLIYMRLNRIAYYKTGLRIALAAAAGLLMFFTVSRISDQYQSKNNNASQVAKLEQQNIPTEIVKETNTIKSQQVESQKTSTNTGEKYPGKNTASYTDVIQKTIYSKKRPEITSSGIKSSNNSSKNVIATPLNQESETAASEQSSAVLNSANTTSIFTNGNVIPVQSENNTALAVRNTLTPDATLPVNEIHNTTEEPRSILFQKEQYPTTTSTYLKQYPPPPPMPTGNKNHVALAMNYLPENIYNGTDNSLFHNVDLTASYNKEKVRFNTSLGMAYNEEQIKFEMNYDIHTPVTAVGPGGHMDTLSYNVSNMASEYGGTEKHKYVTYNLGIGRRLYKNGKFSTWFNAGAGFGIKLTDPDLIATTTSSIKGQYNSQRVSVSSSRPVYNDLNVNFVTAINFNYRIISNLSLSFTPTSRWYFKPVLSLNNQATDELTLGFMSGLKFDF